MSAAFYQPKYLVKFGKQLPTRWNGRDLLSLGHPVRYMLERRGNALWVRDFTAEAGSVESLRVIDFDHLLQGAPALLSTQTKETITLTELRTVTPVAWNLVPKNLPFTLSSTLALTAEDILFKKHLKQGAAMLALLLIAVVSSRLMEPELKTDEAIIPQKFAKIILTKPKEVKSPTTGGVATSRAQAKAVARAFQTKTVQNSLRSILKSGLSKYSVMATGKAIQNLSQKISASETLLGSGLQKKADGLLGAAEVGKPRIGSEGGYGNGQGLSIKGQGNGQFEVGLNTQDASVDEGLTKEEVARVIHSHMNEIRYCYESGILKDPTIAGKLLVDFKINATGVVPNAGVLEASLKDTQVTQCLLGKLKTWKFPHPRGGVNVAVTYPFIFKSLSSSSKKMWFCTLS
jgi:outer membrane biosynthesis protein TonB